MTKIVQLSGGSRETQDLYVGPEREVTVDESNWNLRLHDGATPGGREVLSRDNAEGLFQARSLELDGLLDFTPQQRGFLVRLGPADYRLRSLTVNTASLTLSNGNGYDGNPLLRLADEITSDHEFSGDVVFSAAITAEVGLVGNVVGNLAGNSAGTHTGPVVGNAVGDHSGSFTGDVDVSGGAITFADGQIPLAALAQEILTQIEIPVGGVIQWYGDINDVPLPWLLCDGSNGTPDLRNRFIVGAGDTYDIGDTGGALTGTPAIVVDPAADHAHGVTIDGHTLTLAETPAHRHFSFTPGVHGDLLTASNYPSQETTAGGDTEYHMRGHTVDASLGLTSSVGSGDAHNHTGSAADGGAHTHTAAATAVSTVPPFFALAFIMKGS